MVGLDAGRCTDGTLYLYLLTCDRPSKVPGLLPIGPGAIVDATGWDYEDVLSGLSALAGSGRVIRSARPPMLFVPEALDADRPDPGNVTKGWIAETDEMPDCEPVRCARSMLEDPSKTLPAPFEDPCEDLAKGGRNQPQPQQQHQEQQNNKRASRSAFSEEVLMLWDIYVEEQAKVGIRRRGKPTKPIADPMRSLLREYTVEDVESVIRWAHTSDHQRATFLRSNNNLGKTLFRPSNFSEYLAFAESAEPAPPSKPLSFEDEQRRRRGGRTFEELDAEWRVEWKASEAELVAEYAPERVPRQVENDHVQHWWVAERELRGIT
jgi:hypothetical protein